MNKWLLAVAEILFYLTAFGIVLYSLYESVTAGVVLLPT